MVKISSVIFRAYDIRGIVPDQLDAEAAYTIARAIASESIAAGEERIAVGRDGRLSSPELAQAVIKGLLDSGCQVTDIGAVPSPLLYYATQVLAATSGVMITGSHNPANYNGLKIVIAGTTLAQVQIQRLYKRVQQEAFREGKGRLTQKEMVADYQQRICGDIQLKRPLKVVIDCGNGIAGNIAPGLFTQLGCEVVPLFCEVDGRFPNHHPDPTVVENLQDLIAKVKEVQADVGIALDGDADRLGVVTNQGEIIWPDRQMILFAKDVLARCPGAKIVYDVKCSTHLAEQIRQQGGDPVMSQTGHSLLKAKMKTVGAELAGEMSGHIFFKERWYGFDDGIYAACRLLEILSHTTDTASELFAKIPDSINTPEIKVSVAEDIKFKLVEQLKQQAEFPGAEIITIDGIRVEYPDGWGLLRASNTTACLTLRFEADDQAALTRIQNAFKTQVQRFAPELEF